MNIPSGLCAFPITPSNNEGRVDTASMRKLVARLVAAGVDSIGLLGSTGTYMYLTREERRRAMDAALNEVSGRIPLIVGVGALRTDEAVNLALDAKSAGATAGLLAPVSYTPLTEDEVFTHFATVSEQSDLPLIIYDNPGTTHFRFTPELISRLANLPGVIGIKAPAPQAADATSSEAHYRQLVPDDFSVGYSVDANATEAMLAGGQVWYSVLGGILPDLLIPIVKAVIQGDPAKALSLSAALSPLWDLFDEYSSFRVTYAIAELLGLSDAKPPLPIQALSEPAKNEIRQVIERL